MNFNFLPNVARFALARNAEIKYEKLDMKWVSKNGKKDANNLVDSGKYKQIDRRGNSV